MASGTGARAPNGWPFPAERPAEAIVPLLPRFTLPVVTRAVSRLPAYPAAVLTTAALDFGVGRVLSREAVAPLAGRRFALVVRDLGLSVHFEAAARGFRPCAREHVPDLRVAATLRDFIALALREEDPDTAVLRAAARRRGRHRARLDGQEPAGRDRLGGRARGTSAAAPMAARIPVSAIGEQLAIKPQSPEGMPFGRQWRDVKPFIVLIIVAAQRLYQGVKGQALWTQ